MAVKNDVESPDFSQSWKLSDVVLVVEEEKFHVHRAMLAVSSPVFEKMFTSEFQEKEKNEIPLPGKKASEIKELLSHIYPSAEERAITGEIVYFLLELAHEYQMSAIVKRCEDFMVAKVKSKPKDSILADLVFAQTYNLEKLRQASVKQTHSFSLEDLKSDKMYEQVQLENLKGNLEGIIVRLQQELKKAHTTAERQKYIHVNMMGVSNTVRTNGLREVGKIAELLVKHASDSKGIDSCVNGSDADSYIEALKKDTSGKSCTCWGLSPVATHLTILKQSLESLEKAKPKTAIRQRKAQSYY